MEVTGRRAAFEKMIQERAVYKKLGVERSTVSGWKSRLEQGINISEDKMKEMLIIYGAKLIQEEIWKI